MVEGVDNEGLQFEMSSHVKQETSGKSVCLSPSSLSFSPPLSLGKVLVHCIMGLSRSSTLVLAYLMIHRHLPLRRALKNLVEKRAIYPNRNFLALLLDLDLQLKRKERACDIL